MAPRLHMASGVRTDERLGKTVWSDRRGSAYVETIIAVCIALCLCGLIAAGGDYVLIPRFQRALDVLGSS